MLPAIAGDRRQHEAEQQCPTSRSPHQRDRAGQHRQHPEGREPHHVVGQHHQRQQAGHVQQRAAATAEFEFVVPEPTHHRHQQRPELDQHHQRPERPQRRQPPRHPDHVLEVVREAVRATAVGVHVQTPAGVEADHRGEPGTVAQPATAVSRAQPQQPGCEEQRQFVTQRRQQHQRPEHRRPRREVQLQHQQRQVQRVAEAGHRVVDEHRTADGDRRRNQPGIQGRQPAAPREPEHHRQQRRAGHLAERDRPEAEPARHVRQQRPQHAVRELAGERERRLHHRREARAVARERHLGRVDQPA